jgi:hypothetical protein
MVGKQEVIHLCVMSSLLISAGRSYQELRVRARCVIRPSDMTSRCPYGSDLPYFSQAAIRL